MAPTRPRSPARFAAGPHPPQHPDTLHRRHATCHLGYPARFFHYLQTIADRLVPGGLVITNDYGAASRERARGLFERRPQTYGNSLAQDTNFATFEAFAGEAGWACLRTTNNLDSVHSALVAPDGIGAATRAAFADSYRGSQVIDDLLDHSAIARLCTERMEYARALRYWLRASAVDETNAEFRYRIGECAIECKEYPLAIAHLLAGHQLDPNLSDFDFMLGRAYCLAGDLPECRRWYALSLSREPHPVTYTNLGIVHLTEGNDPEARQCFTAALALDPLDHRAQEQLQLLKDRAWQRTLADWRREPEPPQSQ